MEKLTKMSPWFMFRHIESEMSFHTKIKFHEASARKCNEDSLWQVLEYFIGQVS